jgi:uncharacterized membrane protein
MENKGINKWNDEYMEKLISNLLRWGVIVSSAVVCLGTVIFLAKEGMIKPQYATFTGEPEQFRNVYQILASTLVPSGRGIIETGVLLLITIPLLRVLLSVISFAKEKDKVYVVITTVVLCFLLFSLFYQR